ncbi:hypothetical protein OH76DRAFT_1486132 [Lentinus brumalis]|uniref:DUF6533 domain-containing protein n=1 Tax=Lentinus brumalis TaxID=2498619 RepID=A0A371CZE2_9APHY|nr:hypothetical protein OH76DRAFT_1486132 [Polyporus brumalis]
MADAVASTISIYAIVQDQKYVYAASTAVLAYDILLTLGREAQLFWTGRSTGATILYFTVRSTGLLVNILGFAQYIPTLNQEVILIQQFYSKSLAHVFSGMRVFALTRRWTWGAIVFVLSLAPVAVNLADLIIYTFGATWPLIGCYKATLPMATKIHTLLSFLVLSRGGLVVAVIILVIITLCTLRHGSAAGVAMNSIRVWKRRSLSDIMLWNGVLYFLAITIMNSLQLFLNLGGTETNGIVGWLVAFAPPLNTILISRFLLDLQEAKSQDMRLDGDDTFLFTESAPVRTLTFARVFGSISSTLNPRWVTKGENESEGGDSLGELSDFKFADA